MFVCSCLELMHFDRVPFSTHSLAGSKSRDLCDDFGQMFPGQEIFSVCGKLGNFRF